VDVRELKDEMDGQFEHVQRQFEQVDRRFAELKAELREHIAAEGEKTRRHFDIVAEQISGISLSTGSLEKKERPTNGRFDRPSPSLPPSPLPRSAKRRRMT
jgi:hypothetical protein